MGHFDFLNMAFFTKAAIYPGSVGTFRYRFKRDGWTDGDGGGGGGREGMAGAKANGAGYPALFHPLSRPKSGAELSAQRKKQPCPMWDTAQRVEKVFSPR